MGEEGNQRWLVDVSPLQVVAAGYVVKLVAEVAVSIVEVNVQDDFGECDGPDDGHARREQGVLFARRCGDGGGCGHGANIIIQFSVFSSQSSVVSRQLSVVSCQFSVLSSQFSVPLPLADLLKSST